MEETTTTQEVAPKAARKTSARAAKKEPVEKNAVVLRRAEKRHAVMDSTVLVRPVFTEKTLLGGAKNQYVFEVAIDANKVSVKKAVFNLYGHMPRAVNILKQKGKDVRYGRMSGTRKDWKKAIVSMPKGVSIVPDLT